MDFLVHLSQGFGIALTPLNLLYAFIGAMIGTAIGVLPGLGAPTTIALLLPITFKMGPTSAIIMLAGVFYGAMYGGSTTSILLNIPGEAASITTCLDGYQMARKGRAGPALGISAIGSFIGGTLSVLLMSMVAPTLADIALKFGPAEYTGLLILGMMMAVYLSEGEILKGLLMMAVGVVIGTIGLDPVHGVKRFTFGVPVMMDGFNFVAAGMGFFGIAEILTNLEAPEVRDVYKTSLKGLLPSREDWRKCWLAVLRGSGLGFLIGILPGGGAVIGSFVAYAIEKKISKHPEEFGKGAIEGVAAPESANNAGSTSSFIPLLTLGIPGNATIAMLYVALMIHGVQPGPLLISEHPEVFWGVIASMYVGNVMLLALNLPLIGFWVRLLKVKYAYLALVVIIVCAIGAYSLNNAIFDVGVMMGFGIFGYLAKKGGFPGAPLVLAMLLSPMLEKSIQQALSISGGDLRIFVQKPISATVLLLIIFISLVPVFKLYKNRSKVRDLP
jgi:putative tricarboxylic transport membrane protein